MGDEWNDSASFGNFQFCSLFNSPNDLARRHSSQFKAGKNIIANTPSIHIRSGNNHAEFVLDFWLGRIVGI